LPPSPEHTVDTTWGRSARWPATTSRTSPASAAGVGAARPTRARATRTWAGSLTCAADRATGRRWTTTHRRPAPVRVVDGAPPEVASPRPGRCPPRRPHRRAGPTATSGAWNPAAGTSAAPSRPPGTPAAAVPPATPRQPRRCRPPRQHRPDRRPRRPAGGAVGPRPARRRRRRRRRPRPPVERALTAPPASPPRPRRRSAPVPSRAPTGQTGLAAPAPSRLRTGRSGPAPSLRPLRRPTGPVSSARPALPARPAPPARPPPVGPAVLDSAVPAPAVPDWVVPAVRAVLVDPRVRPVRPVLARPPDQHRVPVAPVPAVPPGRAARRPRGPASRQTPWSPPA
jgi:hypothetical protein